MIATQRRFASVTVGGAVAIHGIRVMNSRKGLFVAMPASNYVDENGETKFSEIAHPISKEARDLLNGKVMEAYHQALDEQQSEDESENMSEDESEALRRVCDFALTFTLDLCIISFNLNGNFGR